MPVDESEKRATLQEIIDVLHLLETAGIDDFSQEIREPVHDGPRECRILRRELQNIPRSCPIRAEEPRDTRLEPECRCLSRDIPHHTFQIMAAGER